MKKPCIAALAVTVASITLFAELERLGRRYDAKSAMKKKDGDFRELIADTLKVLNGPL